MVRRPAKRPHTTARGSWPSRVALVALLASALSAAPAARADTLPPTLRNWMVNEQQRGSRSVDPSRITALTNTQDQRYAPETRNTFPIKSYWIDADRMHSFQGKGLPSRLKQTFMRTHQGKQQIRLLVHPESEALYRDVVRSAQRAPDLLATATASSRTLMVWPQGQPKQAFFAKVSLDKMIGGVRRTVSQGEVARSVGINNVVQSAARRHELPKNFKFLPEVFSAIPRGMEEGGMVIRDIPAEVRQGRVQYVPMFALYGTSSSQPKPLLVEMINKSGLSPEQFVRDKLVRPFVRQWLQLNLGAGIAPQPHAQNLMLEVGADGQPTGNFVHRDFGGFNINFDKRRSAGLAMPRTMPSLGTFDGTYKVSRYGDPGHMMGKLDSFFYGGFIYNLDQQLPQWVERGWLQGTTGTAARAGARPAGRNQFQKMLVQELETQYRAMTGQRANLHGNLRNVSSLASASLLQPAAGSTAQRGSGHSQTRIARPTAGARGKLQPAGNARRFRFWRRSSSPSRPKIFRRGFIKGLFGRRR